LEIPFGFRPKQIKAYKCKIIITMSESLQWGFPILGVTESKSVSIYDTFKVKCRFTLKKDLRFRLPGIMDFDEEEEFTLELGDLPEQHAKNISKWFRIEPVKNTLKNLMDELIYRVIFQPMKPLHAIIDLHITRPSGGRWKFKISVKATTPNIDDAIVIRSPLNRTATIQFKLTNRVKQWAEFVAKFTPESDSEFNVEPKFGRLQPHGK